MYRLQGLVHAALAGTAARAREARGQGTVEYVALILLVALVMAGVVGGHEGLPHRRGQGARRRDPAQDQAGGEARSVLRAACEPSPGGVIGRSPAMQASLPASPAMLGSRRLSRHSHREACAPHPRRCRPPSAVPPFRPVARDLRDLPVAMFDSGVGGLTVLHECLVSLPEEDFLYLGDTARFPYGDRSPDELLGFARQLAEVLIERGAKLLVVACNSATAAALPALRAELEGRTPVVGVVGPEARLAARATKNGKVGLIATPATVASGAYARALAEVAPTAELHAVATAELAPLIQKGGDVDHRVLDCVESACRPLRAAGVDTVILGCTHYPLIRPVLQRELGRGIAIVSSGEAIAEDVHARLTELGLANEQGRRGSYSFLATGDVHEFRRLGNRFLQLPITSVDHLDLERVPGARVAA